MVDSNPQAPLQSITYRHTLNSSQDDAAQFGHLLADQGYDMHQTQLSSRDFKSALLDSNVCDLDSFLYASEAFLSQNMPESYLNLTLEGTIEHRLCSGHHELCEYDPDL